MATTYVQNPKVEVAPMKGETILYNPDNNKFCVLNLTAAFIWQSLGQPRTAEEVAAALVEKFHSIDLERAQQDVVHALDEMHTVECIVVKQTI